MTTLRQMRLYDFPFVRRIISDTEFYDTSLALTSGKNLLEYFFHLSRGKLYPCIYETDNGEMITGLHYPSGFQFARLAYIYPHPANIAEQAVIIDLLDALTAEAGEFGTYTITAEVPADSSVIETLRRAKYSIYTKQGIYIRQPQPVSNSDLPLVFLNPSERSVAEPFYSRNINPLMANSEPGIFGADLVYIVQIAGKIVGLVLIDNSPSAAVVEFHIDSSIQNRAQEIINAAMNKIGAYYKPIYLKQKPSGILSETFWESLGFSHLIDQFVMIRHIASRSHQSLAHENLSVENGILPTVNTVRNSENSI